MGIISWLAANWRFVGAIVIVGAFAWGAALVKGKFDRAADADRIEAQAARETAAANAKATASAAELATLKADVKKTDAARAAIDLIVKEREDGYASIIATLKARTGKASSHGAGCAYDGPAARSVLDDAWQSRAPPRVPDAAGPPH
jgi:hypothetical protein